jgi:uncharacterized lipoprotein
MSRYSTFKMSLAVLMIGVTLGGCSWVREKTSKHRTDYLQSEQKPALKIPEGMDAPANNNNMQIAQVKGTPGVSDRPPATGTVPISLGFVVNDKRDDVWKDVRKELKDYEGLTVRGESQLLSGFDVEVQGQAFIIQVKEAGEKRTQILAVDGTGAMVNGGAAADVMKHLQKKVD